MLKFVYEGVVVSASEKSGIVIGRSRLPHAIPAKLNTRKGVNRMPNDKWAYGAKLSRAERGVLPQVGHKVHFSIDPRKSLETQVTDWVTDSDVRFALLPSPQKKAVIQERMRLSVPDSGPIPFRPLPSPMISATARV